MKNQEANQENEETKVEFLTVEETNWNRIEKELLTNLTEEDITSFLDGIDE